LAVDNAGDVFYAEGSLFELPVVGNLPPNVRESPHVDRAVRLGHAARQWG
jgi:hypothetical protein